MNKKVKILLIIVLIIAVIHVPWFVFANIKRPVIQSSENPDYYYVFDDFQNYYYAEELLNEEAYNKIESITYESPDGQFVISDYKDGICINQYLGKEKDVVIPETINGKKVIKIGGYALFWGDFFGYYATLESAFCDIINPENEDRYYYTHKIESITIPQYVKEIYMGNFQETINLKKIIVADENPYYKSSVGGRILLSKTGHHLLWENIGLMSFDLASNIIYPKDNLQR